MTTQLPLWFETGSLIVLILILVADLLLVIKRPHIPSMRESTLWVSFYVTLALLFAVAMFFFADGEHAGQFLAGWLTEYSLSIDNLFVFVIIMTRFKVPRQYQQEVLMVGIIIALIFRGAFILAGSVVIEMFISVFYLFGVFLLWTAWNQAFGSEDDSDEDNRFVKWLKTRINIADDFDGNKLRTTIKGEKFYTPMLLVFIAIGTTDVMFALDSIPAIFGITQSPFIVFTANIFALMGLRQLYFLLGGLLDRLIYLKYGIAAILAFIGVKLILHAAHENNLPFINDGQPLEWVPDVSTGLSLIVIVGCMAVATVASLIAMKRNHQSVHFGQVEHESHHEGAAAQNHSAENGAGTSAENGAGTSVENSAGTSVENSAGTSVEQGQESPLEQSADAEESGSEGDPDSK